MVAVGGKSRTSVQIKGDLKMKNTTKIVSFIMTPLIRCITLAT